jgi:hypothetical protein
MVPDTFFFSSGQQTGKQRPQPRSAFHPHSEDEDAPGGTQKSSLSPFLFLTRRETVPDTVFFP